MKSVRLAITNTHFYRRRHCLCCGEWRAKDAVVVGAFEQVGPDAFESSPSGIVCDCCLAGDVSALLAASPEPATAAYGLIPTFAELVACRIDTGDLPETAAVCGHNHALGECCSLCCDCTCAECCGGICQLAADATPPESAVVH